MLVDNNKIYFNKDILPFFSNFWPAKIVSLFPYFEAPTSEHLYQAHKSLYLVDFTAEKQRLCFEKIMAARTPGQSKRIAHTYTIDRDKWNADKVSIMRDCVFAKFKQNPDLMKKLLDTGTDELIEYAPWGDDFWGVDKNLQGKNVLGKLLMEVRSFFGKNDLL